jgi:DNA-directed RNA polymerase subunit M/transcription elongation factor TFIIS
MGFFKRMAEKQAESNRKIAEIREKGQARHEELEQKKNEMLDAMHPFSGSKKREGKERIQQLKKEHTPFCPKCKSTSLTYIDKRKKLSLGRAVVGGAIGSLAGPLGTAAGATMGGLSSDKIKKGKVKCLNCGHTWKL